MASEQNYEEAMAQLQYLNNVYTQRYEILSDQIGNYSVAHDAIARNLIVVEKSQNLEDSNILVNCEGGTYLEAKVGKVHTVMTYVGAGYIVDKSIAEAKEFLTTNMKSGEAVINKLLAERQKVEKDLLDLSYRAAELRRVQQ